MDCGLISEKQRGLSTKSTKLDRGLISKKHRGFFAKWSGISAGVYFSTDKAVDRSGALGPPCTDGGVDRGGAGAGRRANRSSARDSPGLERHRGGRATAVKARRRRCSVRGLLRRGERGK
jgi:hypothetical protein